MRGAVRPVRLAGVSPAEARRDLEGLYDHYLLAETTRGRYRFHDLIREHARVLAAAGPPGEREPAENRLLEYYLHAARAAGQQLASRAAPATSGPGTAARPRAGILAGHDAALAWMAAERLNLQAAADFAATSGRPGYAAAIPAAMHEFLRSQGHWDQALTLHLTALRAAHHAGRRPDEARALADLGDIQFLTDDYPAAAATLRRALDLYGGLGDRAGEAAALTSLGTVQRAAGDSRAATASITRALGLYRDLGSQPGEARALTELGALQAITADHQRALASQQRALELYCRLGDRLGEASALTSLGTVQYLTGRYQDAEASHTRALQLYRDVDDASGEAEALNNIADIARATAAPHNALPYYDQALALATRIAAQGEQARALEGIGHCHVTDGHPEHGRELLRQAINIYQRIGSPRAQELEDMLRKPVR